MGDVLGRAPPRARRRAAGLTGSAIETCAAQPGPKKLFSRANVRSMNWSTSTKWPGAYSSFSEPQAEIETRSVTPARFSASMLARKLMADGGTGGRARAAAGSKRDSLRARRTGCRRRARPRGEHALPVRVLQAGQMVEPAAADDAQHGRRHARPRVGRASLPSEVRPLRSCRSARGAARARGAPPLAGPARRSREVNATLDQRRFLAT